MKQYSLSTRTIVTASLIFMSSCTSSDIPQTQNQNDSADYPLVAEVVSRDSERIRIRYTLTNNTEADRIVFDVGRSILRAIVNDNGDLRLFRGQYMANTQFDEPQFISGQVLSAGSAISEVTERPLPITIDFSNSTGYSVDVFEFCVSHGSPTDQALTGDPIFSYYLLGETELSRNECVMLSSQVDNKS